MTISETELARRASRAEFWSRLFNVVLLVLLIAAVATIFRIADVQSRNTAKNDSRDEALAIVKDCVQVNGKCYKRGQRQTADILASAQRIILLSAACAVSLNPAQTVDQRIADITSCVTERLTAPPKP